jgi:hypothetical protein
MAVLEGLNANRGLRRTTHAPTSAWPHASLSTVPPSRPPHRRRWSRRVDERQGRSGRHPGSRPPGDPGCAAGVADQIWSLTEVGQLAARSGRSVQPAGPESAPGCVGLRDADVWPPRAQPGVHGATRATPDPQRRKPTHCALARGFDSGPCKLDRTRAKQTEPPLNHRPAGSGLSGHQSSLRPHRLASSDAPPQTRDLTREAR